MGRSNASGVESAEEIVRNHEGLVFRTLARLNVRRENLEDLAQEVFLRMFRALPHFRGEAKMETFLHRVIINVVKDEWSRRRKAQQSVSMDEADGGWENRLRHPSPDPAQSAQRNELLAGLANALQKLSIDERAILTLFYQEERSYEEIADILALPMGTVKTNLFRAKGRLRSFMKEWLWSCRKTRGVASE